MGEQYHVRGFIPKRGGRYKNITKLPAHLFSIWKNGNIRFHLKNGEPQVDVSYVPVNDKARISQLLHENDIEYVNNSFLLPAGLILSIGATNHYKERINFNIFKKYNRGHILGGSCGSILATNLIDFTLERV